VTGLKYNISQPIRAGRRGFLAFSELQIRFPIRQSLLLLWVIHSLSIWMYTYTYMYTPSPIHMSLYTPITFFQQKIYGKAVLGNCKRFLQSISYIFPFFSTSTQVDLFYERTSVKQKKRWEIISMQLRN